VGRKKKHEEHENLERWLVSYADLITLLFAVFVVLYALANVDIDEFSKLEESLRSAFDSPMGSNIFSGGDGVMSAGSSVFEGGGSSSSGDAHPIMLEFLNVKYETSSMQEMRDEINQMDRDGIEAEITEKGLTIRLDDGALRFAPNSAVISPDSRIALNRISKIISDRFKIHIIRVEGHTDSDPPGTGSPFPSNWELSAARASAVVNFLSRNPDLNPRLFIAAGFGEFEPIAPNDTPANKAKNRRVEIVVLKNKYGRLEGKDMQGILNQAMGKSPRSTPAPEREPENIEQEIQRRIETQMPVRHHHSRGLEFEVPNDASGGGQDNVYLRESGRIRDAGSGASRPSFMQSEGR
jgi:chemotaxis protein MotB